MKRTSGKRNMEMAADDIFEDKVKKKEHSINTSCFEAWIQLILKEL